MPRGERPLEDDGGELTEFAAELRRLREKAGSPPYRRLARDAHYSSTTLADAAAGRRLPSLPVTLAYVRACGGDTAAWEARWRALGARLAAADARTDTAPDPGGGPDQRGPYVGLAAFQPEDADWYFGREHLTEDLVARVRSRRFLAVFGASGSGKSSLLRAGLLPRVGGGDALGWRVVLLAPGAHPLEECAAQLARVTGDSATTLRTDLATDPRALHLTALKALADRPDDVELLVIVDQFEEVFTLCSDHRERTRFIAALLTAARAPNSRTRVVLGVRADFYARCARHPELVEALRDAQLLVGPMNTDELRRAISRPAARAGCTVEGALLARVIADATGRATVLPLVSHALRETWRRRRGNTLTLSGYEAAGGIRHALGQTAETVHAGFDDRQRQLARALLLRLVAVGEGTDATRRRPARADLDSLGGPGTGPGDVRTVLDALAGARLITLDTDTVELTHEALLQAWPRLRHWIDEDRAGLLLRQRLSDAATAWDREHRDPGALYRGTRLDAAEDTFPAQGPPSAGSAVGSSAGSAVGSSVGSELTELERDFLAASTAARERERLAEARTTRRLRRFTLALSVLLLLALLSGLLAWDQYRTSEGHRREAVAEQRSALSRQLAAQSAALLTADSDLASLLAVYAYRIHPTPEATAGLFAAASGPLQQRLTGHRGEVRAVAFSPDARTVVSGGKDGTVRLWNTANGRQERPLTEHHGPVHSVAFSPDGHTVAAGGDDGTVRLWNTATGSSRAMKTRLRGDVRAVAFSPDGNTVAGGGRDGAVRLWDAATGKARRALRGQQGAVRSLAFSPDGRSAAGGGVDGTVRLWDVATGGARVLRAGRSSAVASVAFSPDGRAVTGGALDGTVRVWDVATGKERGALAERRRDAESVAFSPDRRTVLSGQHDGTVRLWDAATGTLRAVLAGHRGSVPAAAFSPDGSTVASGGRDGTVRLWAVSTGKERVTVPGRQGAVRSVAFSPDGRTVAGGARDGTVRLWDAADGRTRRVLTGHQGGLYSVAFRPDGRTVAGGGDDGKVRLWDVATGRAREVLTGLRGAVRSVAFSRDGRTVAAGGGTDVRLWNAETGAPRGVSGRQREGVRSVTFGADGHTLAVGGDGGTLRLWDAATGKSRDVRTGTKSPVRTVAFSPDGRTLAGGADDGTLRLWDTATGAARVTLAGTRRDAQSVAFSPDGRTVAGGDRDGTVRLWDATTGLQHSVLAGYEGAVWSVAFSPDGRTVASGGEDGTLRLWGVLRGTGEAVDRICRSLRRDLSAEERARYLNVPDEGEWPRRACVR
ncbi:hypothetical protein [Streptomyces sp. Je 1-369]|uniref:nSTAND1 domain-containing NTPase n=1 Tax=Streptomyces sp. Je 1-369 TaxID=2966192 RepID=UPI002285E780|nr:hypothetical protein [Streptomyces sp. Je 1-369]WAL98625.1 hypothetical protein NOO62_31555 [Streptomyces sp. Je 1-369]